MRLSGTIFSHRFLVILVNPINALKKKKKAKLKTCIDAKFCAPDSNFNRLNKYPPKANLKTSKLNNHSHFVIICAPEYLRVLSSLPIKFGPDSGLESVSDTWNHEDPRRHPLQQQQDGVCGVQ